jgi:hypothetical protein
MFNLLYEGKITYKANFLDKNKLFSEEITVT